MLAIVSLFISNFGISQVFAMDEQTGYLKSSYDITADSKNPFTVTTEKHLYMPDDNIKIKGSIWSGLITELGGVNQVTVQVLDDRDNVLNSTKSQVNIDGQYYAMITLPKNTQQGEYTINAKLDVSESVLSTMPLKTQASTLTSSKFEMVKPSSFTLKTDRGEFELTIASNSKTNDLRFDEQTKKLTFTVSGETGINGVTDITIPKSLLSGEISVTIDDHTMPQNDVIDTSTSDETMLEINYHNYHSITITGTNVVPEFQMPFVVLLVATASIFVLSLKNKNPVKR